MDNYILQHRDIRNSPPYPIIDGFQRRELSIKQAIRYQRDNKNYKNRDTYVSYTDKDRKTYESWVKSFCDKPIYEVIYTFKQSLICPSKAEQKEVFNNLIKDDDFKRGLSKMYVCQQLISKYPSIDFNNPKTKKMISDNNTDIVINKQSYKTFIDWFTLRNINKDIDKSKTMFIDALKRKGYNAITDLNDYGNIADDPLIVFDIDDIISDIYIKRL